MIFISNNSRRRFVKNSIAGLGFLSLPSSLKKREIKPNIPKVMADEGYSNNENFPIFPKQIFLLDDKGTPLYKKSMFSRYTNQEGMDINLVTTGAERRVIEVNNPTYIKSSDVGNTGRLIVNKGYSFDKIVYKDVSFLKGTSENKAGKTVKIMSLGDSLTEGGAPFNAFNVGLHIVMEDSN